MDGGRDHDPKVVMVGCYKGGVFEGIAVSTFNVFPSRSLGGSGGWSMWHVL